MARPRTHYQKKESHFGAHTTWMLQRDWGTPCAEDPLLFEPIRAGEIGYAPENLRIQTAISRCYRGSDEHPGECPLLLACRAHGQQLLHRHGGIYGGMYFAGSGYKSGGKKTNV